MQNDNCFYIIFFIDEIVKNKNCEKKFFLNINMILILIIIIKFSWIYIVFFGNQFSSFGFLNRSHFFYFITYPNSNKSNQQINTSSSSCNTKFISGGTCCIWMPGAPCNNLIFSNTLFLIVSKYFGVFTFSKRPVTNHKLIFFWKKHHKSKQ